MLVKKAPDGRDHRLYREPPDFKNAVKNEEFPYPEYAFSDSKCFPEPLTVVLNIFPFCPQRDTMVGAWNIASHFNKRTKTLSFFVHRGIIKCKHTLIHAADAAQLLSIDITSRRNAYPQKSKYTTENPSCIL